LESRALAVKGFVKQEKETEPIVLINNVDEKGILRKKAEREKSKN